MLGKQEQEGHTQEIAPRVFASSGCTDTNTNEWLEVGTNGKAVKKNNNKQPRKNDSIDTLETLVVTKIQKTKGDEKQHNVTSTSKTKRRSRQRKKAKPKSKPPHILKVPDNLYLNGADSSGAVSYLSCKQKLKATPNSTMTFATQTTCNTHNAKRELQQTEQLQKKAEKEALTAKAEAEESTELSNEMEAQLSDIEMVNEIDIAHIEANHAEQSEEWRRHAQSQQAAQMDVLSREESMRSEIATIENDKKDAETRCQKLEYDVSRWQQSYESIGAKLGSLYQELNHEHVSSQQNGANEAVLSVVQKELKEKTTCLANMKTQYNESIQLTKILQNERRMFKNDINMLKKENLLLQENFNVAKETLTKVQNASNASNRSQGLTSSTSQSHNADNFGPLNVAGRQTQVERECELLRRRVDEKDRRIEQLIVEKNSLQIDLERLHQETAKHYAAEKAAAETRRVRSEKKLQEIKLQEIYGILETSKSFLETEKQKKIFLETEKQKMAENDNKVYKILQRLETRIINLGNKQSHPTPQPIRKKRQTSMASLIEVQKKPYDFGDEVRKMDLTASDEYTRGRVLSNMMPIMGNRSDDEKKINLSIK